MKLPPWRYRRRVIGASVIASLAMIAAGIANAPTDAEVAVELTRSAVALLSITVTAYVGGAVVDDYVHRAAYQEQETDD